DGIGRARAGCPRCCYWHRGLRWSNSQRAKFLAQQPKRIIVDSSEGKRPGIREFYARSSLVLQSTESVLKNSEGLLVLGLNQTTVHDQCVANNRRDQTRTGVQ